MSILTSFTDVTYVAELGTPPSGYFADTSTIYVVMAYTSMTLKLLSMMKNNPESTHVPLKRWAHVKNILTSLKCYLGGQTGRRKHDNEEVESWKIPDWSGPYIKEALMDLRKLATEQGSPEMDDGEQNAMSDVLKLLRDIKNQLLDTDEWKEIAVSFAAAEDNLNTDGSGRQTMDARVQRTQR